MANILITGGAGYIGSHTTQALRDAGHHVRIFDNFSTGHREFVLGAPLFEGHLADEEALQQAFQISSFDAVIHFASHCYVGESYLNPFKYYHDNILHALNLLRAMTRAGVRKIIFSSTCAVYGTPQSVPIPEEHPTNPINAYGHSKRCIEWMLEDFRRAHSIEYVSLRYFNAAGADPMGRLGEWHEPETHLIPRLFMAATGQIGQMEIYGQDYPTIDGTCIRDYIHVTDLASAHLSALEHLLAGNSTAILNLGTGRGYSVREILETAVRIIGLKIPASFGPRRLGDPPELVAVSSKAGKMLGWKPGYSNLETILDTAWKWFLKLKDREKEG
jgi:UDP-glucose-4-epimerase GalE